MSTSPRNQSDADRKIRVTLGVLMLALAAIPPVTAWGLLGLVPLLTGLTGRCPVYRAFGISTLEGPATR